MGRLNLRFSVSLGSVEADDCVTTVPISVRKLTLAAMIAATTVGFISGT